MSAELDPLPARWYCVSRDGLATLCLDEANAREMAAQCAHDYPRQAPYRAVILGDVAAERERCIEACRREYLEDPQPTEGDVSYTQAVADCIAAILRAQRSS